ncbi:hypothetical protein AO368_0018 [Moraxella catarrhalis]|nr:hypothetical protein AO368_0018 [Moraxella catarrhalis]
MIRLAFLSFLSTHINKRTPKQCLSVQYYTDKSVSISK